MKQPEPELSIRVGGPIDRTPGDQPGNAEPLTAKNLKNFWRKVDKNGPNGCWIWTGARNKAGYGTFWVTRANSNCKAHRISYEIHVGPIPAGLLICHRCDNPACVNPAHLFTGTDLDNARDRDSKERRKPPMGESNGRAKLNAQMVADIKSRISNGEIHRVLAQEYGVCKSVIDRISRAATWRHLNG